MSTEKSTTDDREVDIFEVADAYRHVGEVGGRTDELRPWAAAGDEWANSLFEARIFMLVAEGEELLNVAVERIAGGHHFARESKHLLHLEQANARKIRIEHARRARPAGKARLLIINATRGNARVFLDDLLDCSALFLRGLRASLQEGRTWVLICALREHVEDRLLDVHELAHAIIPVLPPAVEELAHRTALDDAETSLRLVEETCAEIRKQQAKGIWGKSDRDLYQRLRYVPDFESLLRLVEERRGGGLAARSREQAQRILADAGPMKMAALYVATFLPDSTPADFDRAVRALLVGRTEKRRVPWKTVRREGVDRAIEFHQETSCGTLWRDARQEIFRSSSLRGTAEGGSRLGGERLGARIGFADPELREAMKRALLEHDPWIHHESLRAFRRANLLFTSGYELQHRIVRLLAYEADIDRDELFMGWIWPSLEETIVGPVPWRASPEHDGDGDGDSRRLLLDLSSKSKRAVQADRLERHAEVFAALIQEGQRGIVDLCLDWLLEREMFEQFLEIVWSLQAWGGFDEAQWLQRLVEDTRSGAHQERKKSVSGESAPGTTTGSNEGSTSEGSPVPESGGENAPSTGAQQPENRPTENQKARQDSAAKRTSRLTEYLDGHWAQGRDGRGIRHLLGALLDWAKPPRDRALAPREEMLRWYFAQDYLVQLVDSMVRTSFEPWEARALARVGAALSEEREIVVARGLLSLVLHTEREHAVDERLSAMVGEAWERFGDSKREIPDEERTRYLALLVAFWLLPRELFELTNGDVPRTLYRKVAVDRFKIVLDRVSGDTVRGEHGWFPYRHFYDALCLAGMSVLMSGDRWDEPAAERVRLLATSAAAACEPLQQKRMLLYLGAFDEAFADAVGALGEISRTVSPSRHDALRARLMHMRQAVRAARAHLGAQPARDDAKQLEERA